MTISKHNYSLYLAYAFIFAMFSIAQAKDSQETKPEKNQQSALTVTVTRPVLRRVEKNIQASGNIEAQEIALVSAQTSGLSLDHIYVDIGDTIKKGQLLAEYDITSVNNDINYADASLKQAKIQRDQAKKNAKRATNLRHSKAITQQQIDNYFYQKKLADTQIKAAQATLDKQKLRADYARVTAKFNGLVIEKQATLGQIGNFGTPLFSVIVNNTLEWRANVPSTLLHEITPDTPVQIFLSETSNKTVYSDKQIALGVVKKIGPTIDPKTRQGIVYVTMKENNLLRRGLFVRGIFKTGSESLLAIPSTSIIHKDGYSYVFTVAKNNRVSQKKITTGEMLGDEVIILNGLNQDDRVISSGIGFLKNDDLVHVVE